MGIRESLRQKPAMAVALGAGLVVVGAALAVLQLAASGSGGAGGGGEMAYFTTDDGQTWFADDGGKLAPFNHDGKDAVRAYVFTCGGKTFVNHLERYTAESHRKLIALNESMRAGKSAPPVAQLMAMREVEVKKPGAGEWVSAKNVARSAAIIRPACPAGMTGEPTPVVP